MLGPVVGNFFNSFFEFLYEQCSLHITEKIPSSVKFGSRPRIFLIRLNSSGVSPCFATISGVIFGSTVAVGIKTGRLAKVPVCSNQAMRPAVAPGRVLSTILIEYRR